MGSEVPLMPTSPNMEAKSQVLSLKKSLKQGLISVKVSFWLLHAKKISGLCELGLALCSTHCNTEYHDQCYGQRACIHAGIYIRALFLLFLLLCSTQHSTQIAHLTSKKLCHVGNHAILKTWDPCEVVRPNFHILNGRGWKDWPQVKWALGLGTCVHQPWEVHNAYGI